MRAGEAEAVRWRQWLGDIAGLADSTLDKYTRIMRQYLTWCEDRDIDPLQAEVEHLEAFISRKNARTGRVRAAPTRSLDGTVVRLWYNWMHKRGIMQYDPTLDLRLPTIRDSDPVAVDEDDWLTLWYSPLSPRVRATLGLAYYAGLRVGELISLRELGEQELRVMRKGGEVRSVPWLTMVQIIHHKLPNLLPEPWMLLSAIEHVRRAGQPACPWQSASTFGKRLRALCWQAGIEPFPPHAMRKSACTNLLDAGVPLQDVSQQLNHKDLKTTMRYYAGGNVRLKAWFARELAA